MQQLEMCRQAAEPYYVGGHHPWGLARAQVLQTTSAANDQQLNKVKSSLDFQQKCTRPNSGPYNHACPLLNKRSTRWNRLLLL